MTEPIRKNSFFIVFPRNHLHTVTTSSYFNVWLTWKWWWKIRNLVALFQLTLASRCTSICWLSLLKTFVTWVQIIWGIVLPQWYQPAPLLAKGAYWRSCQSRNFVWQCLEEQSFLSCSPLFGISRHQSWDPLPPFWPLRRASSSWHGWWRSHRLEVVGVATEKAPPPLHSELCLVYI